MPPEQAVPVPVVRREVPARPLAPGVTVTELLDDRQGCRGLHQRRLRFAAGAGVAGVAGGRGEAWYVIAGPGTLDAGKGSRDGTVALEPGTAVWLPGSLGYRCEGLQDGLDIVAATVRAGDPAASGPGLQVTTLDACVPERTGDREFRVLLSSGLTITQFAGLIPPGRAPEHHHAYDEVVHVLAGQGVVHLRAGDTPIGPGTSIYLPPYQPHCLENTGQDPLQVLGVFHPAGSPAAKREN
jgi:mannose-6-phosphate isomerase-like protein (cupin superfamily)